MKSIEQQGKPLFQIICIIVAKINLVMRVRESQFKLTNVDPN